ncbi:metallophosphoesterase [Anaerobacillus alkaliphilus]|uniref:Metallophosphoesterase n=1 Tax=Anaerobacillus alkaliphilus TaxID=1548597 RepID=A0A4Q0VNT0_9BACI|nr:metallophosphoesterase [Anaerobacillus alkaliphilus]RXI96764.1 metallophosphoesterase [Anaerobacillus alkaliphilus]
MLVVYNTLVFYIGWNGLLWLTTIFPNLEAIFYWIAIYVWAYAYVLTRFIQGSLIKIIGAYWIAVVQYSIIILPITNLVTVVLLLMTYNRDQLIFWIGTIVFSIYILIFTYGSYNAYSPVVRKYQISVPKNGGNYKKLRIAVASDMHFGNLSGRSHLRRLVDQVNHIKPDLVLLPGDIIDDDPKPFIEKKMSKMMKEMHAPLGIFGVLGNHEYYGRAIPLFVNEMAKQHIKILMDEVVLIDDSFYLVGRKDKTDRNRLSISKLMETIDQSKPIILLDHQPYELGQAMDNHVDISLSGHTHRGQMAPNHVITKRMYELDWGYKQKEQLHAFVSSGFGFWGPPLRIGSRSEILQIDISFE